LTSNVVPLPKDLKVRSILIEHAEHKHRQPSKPEVMMNPSFVDTIAYAKTEAKTQEEIDELDGIYEKCHNNFLRAKKQAEAGELVR
jgi:hypothetical protein